MPFDALVRSPKTLADAAFDLGITPVPAEVLAEHKRTEQAKCPPASKLYPYLGLLRFGMGVLTIFTLVAGIAGIINVGRSFVVMGIPSLSFLFGLAVISMPVVAYASSRVLRGPAEWIEYTPSFMRAEAPEALLKMALHLVATTPGARMVIGELRQSSVLLDPYLVVRKQTEEVCLGIWIGRDILHQATQTRTYR